VTALTLRKKKAAAAPVDEDGTSNASRAVDFSRPPSIKFGASFSCAPGAPVVRNPNGCVARPRSPVKKQASTPLSRLAKIYFCSAFNYQPVICAQIIAYLFFNLHVVRLHLGCENVSGPPGHFGRAVEKRNREQNIDSFRKIG
jgi:hypothetical protein